MSMESIVNRSVCERAGRLAKLTIPIKCLDLSMGIWANALASLEIILPHGLTRLERRPICGDTWLEQNLTIITPSAVEFYYLFPCPLSPLTVARTLPYWIIVKVMSDK